MRWSSPTVIFIFSLNFPNSFYTFKQEMELKTYIEIQKKNKIGTNSISIISVAKHGHKIGIWLKMSTLMIHSHKS